MLENALGLFVGYAAIPFETGIDVAKIYFDLLFKNYRTKINEVNPISLDENLFLPKYYHILGHHDLAMIAWVDDFTFGQQKFKPFSEMAFCSEINCKLFNFNYQVNNSTFYSKEKNIQKLPNHPAIVISQLKIKNSLILGNNENVFAFAQEKISNVIEEFCKTRGISNLNVQISHTHSWHEIMMILYGEDVKVLADAFLMVREMKLSTNEFKASLAYEVDPNQQYPLFSFTHSYFGLSCDLEETELQFYRNEMNLFTKFFVRPGHIENLPSKDIHFLVGNGDVAFMPKQQSFLMMNKPTAPFNKIIRGSRSIPSINIKVNTTSEGIDTIVDGNKSLELVVGKIGITDSNIKNVDKILTNLKIEKAIRSRVLKTLINYHDAINDPAMYIYTIELSPIINSLLRYLNNLNIRYLEDTKLTAKDYGKIRQSPTLLEINKELSMRAGVFEIAYRCRMQHSLRTLDMTDSTLEYSGGLQQIISAYDSLFKIFRRSLGYYKYTEFNKNSAVAYITNTSGINSDIQGIQVNYMYLAQPEFFIATLFKESLNHLITMRKVKLNSWPDERVLSMEDVVKFYNGDYKAVELGSSNPIIVNADRYRQFTVLCELQENAVLKTVLRAIMNDIQEQALGPNQVWAFFEYTTLISKPLLEYLTYDQFNFEYYYQKDSESYFFWLWHMFFQERMHYETDGVLKSDFFLRSLFRSYYTIFSIRDESKKAEAQTVLDSIINSYEQGKLLYSRHMKTFRNFFTFLVTLNGGGSQVIGEIFHFSYIRDFNEEQNYNGILAEFVASPKGHKEFEIIRDELHSYLSVIRKICQENNTSNIIKRCLKNGTVILPKDGSIAEGIYFDCAGGFFLTGKQRLNYFNQREKLILYLTSLSNKFKLSLFKDMANENETN
jgi:hypothetical protein